MIRTKDVARAAVVAAMVLLAAGAVQAAITIDMVPVGNPGNAANYTGYGAVAYTYNIGKYEVTAGQYTAFLNAVAATDTYGLYNTNMDTAVYILGCNIKRTGSLGNYTYSVPSDYANRPVNYVSFWDSCRFANWLHNGQGNGSTETGAYTLTTSGIANNTITRNDGWKWAVTSEDEWCKAAYYNPATGTYFSYPTSSNTAPGRDMADASGNNANYDRAPGPYPIDSGKYTTVAGEFQNSDSPYGTFDQGGNVSEWNEAVIDGTYRGHRGGFFASQGSVQLHSSVRAQYDPTGDGNHIGFRVSEVPEPATMSLLALGGLGMLMRRRSVRG